MKRRVQDEAPGRSKEAKAWLDENTSEQAKRYAGIAKEMDELSPKRAKWYADFLNIMKTRGFHWNGDQRRVIPEDQIPKKPDRPDKVVW